MGLFGKKTKTATHTPVISGPIGSDFLDHSLSGGFVGKPKDVVFAGHGSFNSETDKNFPKVRLPPSVTLVFWCLHGEALIDTVGHFIESHRDLRELPQHLQQINALEGNSNAVPEVIKGGSEIWNYRLTYPSGLNLGAKPASVPSSVYNPPSASAAPMSTPTGAIGDRRYCVVPPLSGDIGDRGVPIIALIAANWNICDGAVIHWCACRSIRDR